MPTHRFVDQTKANTTKENGDKPVEDKEHRDRSKEGIPEPEYKVDLLIDNVLKYQKLLLLTCLVTILTCVSTHSPLCT